MKHETYSPFTAFDERSFLLTDAIIIKQNKDNNMCVNNYVIHKSIGKGSYATVRLGYDVFMDEQVALRIVNRQLLARKVGQLSIDKMMLNALKISSIISNKYIITLKEFIYSNIYYPSLGEKVSYIPVSHKLFQRFSSPPTITGDYDPLPLEECDDGCRSTTPRSQSSASAFINSAIFVLEYANRGSLDKFINAKGSSEDRLKNIVLQIANAISAFHHHGIIFNDLKSDNVLLVQDSKTNDITAKLTDFDTATIFEEQTLNYMNFSDIENPQDILNQKFIVIDPLSENYQYVTDIVCTPAIAAPESRNKFSYFKGFHSDIWQYGVLAYNALTNLRRNMPMPRKSKEYYQILDSFGPEFADLMCCSLEANSALRYDIDDIIEHPWFIGKEEVSLRQFHQQIAQEKLRKTFVKSTPKMRRGSFSGRDSDEITSRKFDAYVSSLYHHLIRDVNYLTKHAKFDLIYSMRSNQSEFLTDFATTFSVVARPVELTKNRLRKSSSQQNLINTCDIYNLNVISQLASESVAKHLNNKDFMSKLTLDHVIIQDLPKISPNFIYEGMKILYNINFFIRYCNFHLTSSYYSQEDEDYQSQLNSSQSTTKINSDLAKRAADLKQRNNIQLSSRLIELKPKQQYQYLPPQTPIKPDANKWKELEEDSDDDYDLLAKPQPAKHQVSNDLQQKLILPMNVLSTLPLPKSNQSTPKFVSVPKLLQQQKLTLVPKLKIDTQDEEPEQTQKEEVVEQPTQQVTFAIPKLQIPQQEQNQVSQKPSVPKLNLSSVESANPPLKIIPKIDPALETAQSFDLNVTKAQNDSSMFIPSQQKETRTNDQITPLAIANTDSINELCINQQNKQITGQVNLELTSPGKTKHKIQKIQFSQIQVPLIQSGFYSQMDSTQLSQFAIVSNVMSSMAQKEDLYSSNRINRVDEPVYPLSKSTTAPLKMEQSEEKLIQQNTAEFHPSKSQAQVNEKDQIKEFGLINPEQVLTFGDDNMEVSGFESARESDAQDGELPELEGSKIKFEVESQDTIFVNKDYEGLDNRSVVHKNLIEKMEIQYEQNSGQFLDSDSEEFVPKAHWTGIKSDQVVEESFTADELDLLKLVGKNLQFRTYEPPKRTIYQQHSDSSSQLLSEEVDFFPDNEKQQTFTFGSNQNKMESVSLLDLSKQRNDNPSTENDLSISTSQIKSLDKVSFENFPSQPLQVTVSLVPNTVQIDEPSVSKYEKEEFVEKVSDSKMEGNCQTDVWNIELGALGALFNVVKATGPEDYYIDVDMVDNSIGDCSSESSDLMAGLE